MKIRKAGIILKHETAKPRKIAKELTKLHENFMRGSAMELLTELKQDSVLSKGEFVVLIDNSEAPASQQLNTDDVEILRLLLEEVSVKIAVKIAMRLTGKKKNELYQQALQLQDGSESKLMN